MSFYTEDLAKVTQLIIEECKVVAQMLVGKNKSYGNSAIDPIRIFSKADPIEQLNVRIDDKLSRIYRGTEDNEDTVLDLIGYLILKRVYTRLMQDEHHSTD